VKRLEQIERGAVVAKRQARNLEKAFGQSLVRGNGQKASEV
jgi:hypothetical protein